MFSRSRPAKDVSHVRHDREVTEEKLVLCDWDLPEKGYVYGHDQKNAAFK